MERMATSTAPAKSERQAAPKVSVERNPSIDALRGLVMFTMIFVNDIAGVSNKVVPRWLKHFHGKSGMTFVDLVFPAFLFIVGMSIPFALGSRLKRGEPLWRTVLHVLLRTVSLLFIGILMVNETPDSASLGWSGALWVTLMFLAAILAFCSLSPPRGPALSDGNQKTFRLVSVTLRVIGLGALVWLAFAFRGPEGRRIISFSPFSLRTEWFGILGLIGWAYLVGCAVFLIFRGNRTALLGSAVLLMCLYPADRKGLFEGLWLSKHIGIGEMLGAHAAITVAGLLLGTMLLASDTGSVGSRARFTLLFIAGFAAAAVLLKGIYGINKNSATPSWCYWACAITATLWLFLYLLSEAGPLKAALKPLAIAGQNVFLAYLLSEMLPSLLEVLRLDGWYDRLPGGNLGCAIARSTACGVLVLCASAGLNKVGFRLRL
jgi:heparan-alpha-glucosaminide N-acetyltransferase